MPPDQRPKVPGEAPSTGTGPTQPPSGYKDTDRHLGEQGRQGNIKQNTTNKGLQHDR